jgi:hypothetical protein
MNGIARRKKPIVGRYRRRESMRHQQGQGEEKNRRKKLHDKLENP